jgi:uncharacterized protein (UPF0332 family)
MRIAMDPRDFNQVAIDIVVRRPLTGPAAYRSAISRAYFAVLNAAADVLSGIGHSPGKGDSKHKRLVIYLQQSGDAKLEDAGARIDDLRNQRNSADYDMGDITVERLDKARFAAETARQAIEYLDEFASDSARRDAAADAIARYRAKTRT